MITASIISHGHGEMVSQLTQQLQSISLIQQIIITHNIPELLSIPISSKILIIKNRCPSGFGKNHNIAFKYATQPYFCILNPDIVLQEDPFPYLINALNNQSAALVAPQILSKDKKPEDNIRHFPTMNRLLKKLFFGTEGASFLIYDKNIVYPDWVAGMFMLFQSKDYAEIDGFNEKYYLYYEDVDICRRLHKANKKIIAELNTSAIHHAQRASHKNIKHFYWHITSMTKFLLSNNR